MASTVTPSTPAGAVPRADWAFALALVVGAVASFVPMILAIEAIEGGRSDPTGRDGDLAAMVPLALLGALAAVASRHHARTRAFFLGWTALQTLLLAMSAEAPGLLLIALVAGWATLAMRLAAPTRFVLAAPVTFLAVFAAAFVAGESGRLAAVSGLFAAAGGMVYFVGWGLREPLPWARHLAYACACAWALVVAAVALNDLGQSRDTLTLAGVALAVVLLLGAPILWGWGPHARAPASA